MNSFVFLREWGTILLVFLLPWQARWIAREGWRPIDGAKLPWLTLSLYATEVLVGLLIIFALADRDFRLRLRSRLPRLIIYPLALIVLFSLLSIFWSADRDLALQKSVQLILALSVLPLCIAHQKPKNLVSAFLLSAGVQAFLGAAQSLAGFSPASTWLGVSRQSGELAASVAEGGDLRVLRAYGTLPHPNILGGYLAAAILLALVRYREAVSRNQRIFFIVFLSLLFFALFFTFSRSAWLAVSLGSLPLLYALVKERAGAHLLLPLALVPALLAAIVFAPVVAGRLTGAGRLEVRSTKERVTSLADGFAVFMGSGGLGVGVGQINPKAYGSPTISTEPAHLVPLQFAAELGIIGLLLFLFFAWRLWRAARATPLSLALFLLLSTVSLFDHYLWTLWAGNLLSIFAIFAILRAKSDPAFGGS
ncbi:hypothetical protein EPN90_03695 [Patescibacteria group bacterium]|nr:MAG: hypothetical protein EPN90_03695 [Patescibacteria group bacterium]